MSWEQLEKTQPIALKIIANSIQKKRVAHAYLLEGEKGTGKEQVAYLFAKALFCLEKKIVPCKTCINCRRIESRNHPDVHIIEPDGMSIKKEQIATLQQEFIKTGVESSQKLYIICHADKMTNNAANSLLKFLEEPNEGTVAILLTEQVQRMLSTILSRCQVLTFQPLQKEMMIQLLIEQNISRPLAITAAQLTNNQQEALELCQDEWFVQARKIVIQLYETVHNDYMQAMLLLLEWMSHFNDKEKMSIGLELLLYAYKDTLYIQLDDVEKVIFVDKLPIIRQLGVYSQTKIAKQMEAILSAKGRLNTNMNPQLLMEQLVLLLKEGF